MYFDCDKTFLPGLNRLRKNSPHQAMVRRRVQQGLKPSFVLQTLVARLNSLVKKSQERHFFSTGS